MGMANLRCCINNTDQIKRASIQLDKNCSVNINLQESKKEVIIIDGNENKVLNNNIPIIKICETNNENPVINNETENKLILVKEQQITEGKNKNEMLIKGSTEQNKSNLALPPKKTRNRRASCLLDLNSFLQFGHDNTCEKKESYKNVIPSVHTIQIKKNEKKSLNLDINNIENSENNDKDIDDVDNISKGNINNYLLSVKTNIDGKLNKSFFNRRPSRFVAPNKEISNEISNEINKESNKENNKENNKESNKENNKKLHKESIIKNTHKDSIDLKETSNINNETEELSLISSTIIHEKSRKYSQGFPLKVSCNSNNRLAKSSFKKHRSRNNSANLNFIDVKPMTPILSSKSPKKRKHENIKEIQEPFNEKQINKIKEILIHEELINEQMDDCTINMIINSLIYLKVKVNTILFSHPNKVKNQKENVYYIVEKGKLEYQLDNEIYEVTKYGGISTNALINYSKKNCVLKAAQRCYLYVLSIEKFKSISEDYMEKLYEEKAEILKNNFFFKKLSNEFIHILASNSSIIKYKNKEVIINEEQFSDSFFIIIEGCVYCTKQNELFKILYHGELFGEVSLFSQVESLYGFTVESDTTILKLPYECYISLFNKKAVKYLISTIFENSVSEDKLLSKYIIKGVNMEQVFNCFQLRFYYNDVIQSLSQKKIILPISGWAYKVNNQKSKNNIHKMQYKLDNCIPKGKFFMECVLSDTDYSYRLIGDESVIFECTWEEFQKNLPKYNKRENITTLTGLLKNLPQFRDFSLFKIYELAHYMQIEKYKEGQCILKDGPNSDFYYIIKSGEVQMAIKQAVMKSLFKDQFFGDIFGTGIYQKKVNFYAKTDKTECYVLSKDIYKEITEIDKDMLAPINDLLSMNYMTLSLENLFYVNDIGSGAYGKVNLVHDTHKLYAMKSAEIQVMNEKKEMAKLYINEKQIMFGLHHPFVVQLHNTFKTNTSIYFLMEFIDGLTLRKYLDNKINKNSRNLDEVKFYGSILFSVLYYFQKNRIIHRDLKPENLIIEYTGYLKVIDFGAATVLKDKDYASTFMGTPHYMAPEVVTGKKYSFPVDYWSVGVILYEIFYGQLPFGNGMKDFKEVFKEIANKKIVLPSDPKNAEFNTLIKLMLHKNPSNRLCNFNKIKELKFFSDLDFDALLKMNIRPFCKPNRTYKIEEIDSCIPYTQYIKDNAFISSNDFDELKAKSKNSDDILNDF